MGRPSGPSSTRRRFFRHRLSILRGCGTSMLLLLLLPPPADAWGITSSARDGLAVEQGTTKAWVIMGAHAKKQRRRIKASCGSALGGLDRNMLTMDLCSVLGMDC